MELMILPLWGCASISTGPTFQDPKFIGCLQQEQYRLNQEFEELNLLA